MGSCRQRHATGDRQDHQLRNHVIAAEDRVGWSGSCIECPLLVGSCRQGARLSGRQLHHKQGHGVRHRNVRKQGVQ